MAGGLALRIGLAVEVSAVVRLDPPALVIDGVTADALTSAVSNGAVSGIGVGRGWNDASSFGIKEGKSNGVLGA